MPSLRNHLSVFALAASAVTSAQAGAQEACLHQLLPNLIAKTAQPLASGKTIMGNISSAYAVERDKEPAIAVFNSHANTVFFYKMDSKALAAISGISISPIGTLELGSLQKNNEDTPHGPDEAKGLFPPDKWPEKKDAFAACFLK